jgi:hypothetical protein
MALIPSTGAVNIMAIGTLHHLSGDFVAEWQPIEKNVPQKYVVLLRHALLSKCHEWPFDPRVIEW